MSSFLQGVSIGSGIVQGSIDNARQAKEWRDKLKAQALAHDDASKALEVEAKKYKDTRDDKKLADFEKEVADDRAQGAQSLTAQKDASAEKHARKQDELIDAEIASMKAGTGKNGSTRNAVIPPEVKVAISNRDSARKSISALAAGGILTPPPEMQAKLDAAEGALSRVAKAHKFDLGEDAQATEDFHKSLAAIAAKSAADAEYKKGYHPVDWFKKVTGQDTGNKTPGSVVTKYKNGKPVQVIDHGDGTFSPVE